jgi:CRP/FNR family transcriptional regulator
MAQTDALALLQGLPLFAGVQPQTLLLITTRLHRHRYGPGEALVQQDEPAYSLHVIYRGSVKVTRTTEEGEQLVLGLVGPAECIGEVATLDGGLRSATVTAVEPIETLSLVRDDLLGALREDREFALALISTLARRYAP